MLNRESLSTFEKWLAAHAPGQLPAWQIVWGSGFGQALDELLKTSRDWKLAAELPFNRIPGLKASTVSDHASVFSLVQHQPSRKTVLLQRGRIHGYEGHPASEAVAPVMLGRAAGVKQFILTNAAGGIDPAHRTGDAMLICDHVNLTGQNPLMGPNPTDLAGKPWGPRFPDMGQAYDSEWNEGLRKHLTESQVRVHEGVYIGLLGPSFETPAEIGLFAQWGIHAVGMSTVWEAIVLKHSGARVAALSLISNPAAGTPGALAQTLDHEPILETCRGAAARIAQGVLGWVGANFK